MEKCKYVGPNPDYVGCIAFVEFRGKLCVVKFLECKLHPQLEYEWHWFYSKDWEVL